MSNRVNDEMKRQGGQKDDQKMRWAAKKRRMKGLAKDLRLPLQGCLQKERTKGPNLPHNPHKSQKRMKKQRLFYLV